MQRTNVSQCGHYVAQICVSKLVCSPDIGGALANTDLPPRLPPELMRQRLRGFLTIAPSGFLRRQAEGAQRLDAVSLPIFFSLSTVHPSSLFKNKQG